VKSAASKTGSAGDDWAPEMPMNDQLALTLTNEFLAATGVIGPASPRRYLWTDAFAVTNLLGFHRRTQDPRYLALARRLVDQVHEVLGRRRADDSRSGWISGLAEDEGARRPTAGGLRIGKPLPERRPGEPYDARQEWDRDGQYFHYLTKWAHALVRMRDETGELSYADRAVDLMATAHRGFTYVDRSGQKRMYWKMSVDLDRPLVTSMGAHDPPDGLVACLEASRAAGNRENNTLAVAAADLERMGDRQDWTTDDPLGIGGLLEDAVRLSRLVVLHGVRQRSLVHRLLDDAERSLAYFERANSPDGDASRRLAFRELGLAIGLGGVKAAHKWAGGDGELNVRFRELLRFSTLIAAIDDFWSDPNHRLVDAWLEHADINGVMLATSLMPEGYFGDA
jgi:hypothetical protein